MQREAGFYWTRLINGTWVVSEWDSHCKWWRCIGIQNSKQDEDFIEIDERPIIRIEPPIGFVDKDMGHGKCMEKFCSKYAVTDYNGHGHWVCQRHDDILNAQFEDEYK